MNSFDQIANEILNFKKRAEIKKWNSFELDFSTSFENKDQIIGTIKKEIPNYRTTTGFYSIFKNDQCLYIGIGRPIWKRIKDHYYASKSKINPKFNKWIEFFDQNQSKLTIYWTEFKGTENNKQSDKLREIIENILELKYEPEFERKNAPQQRI
jgi:hypothetical protein